MIFFLRLVQVHPPAQIAAQHRDVVLPERGKALAELFGVVLPVYAENIHGLILGKGEMQIPDGVQCHSSSE